jgi:hypothetical protein
MLERIADLHSMTGAITLPIWAAGAAIILFVVACILAVGRAGASAALRAVVQAAVVLIVAIAAWAFVGQSAIRERDAERRALDARSLELTSRAMTAGSPLACLDAVAGETVENACEKALFASAETTASALSYVAARLKLLTDAVAYANRRDPSYELVLSDWRHALETDRFGLVAHLLATRDGCSADECPAFSLLRDTSRISANLKEHAFEQSVARHAAAWGIRTGTPAVMMGPNASSPQGAPGLATSSTSTLSFPSAASIPAVSIMSAEPTGSVQQGASAAEPIANPPTPPRRPPRRPANQPAAVGPPPSAGVTSPPPAQ